MAPTDDAYPVDPPGKTYRTESGRVLGDADFDALADEAEREAAADWQAEVVRLRRVMAAALERADVGDAGEAAMILEAEVNLDGTPRNG